MPRVYVCVSSTPSNRAVYQNQIVCTGCQTLLMYPQGASNVRCSRCHHITAVTQGGERRTAPHSARPADSIPFLRCRCYRTSWAGVGWAGGGARG